MANRPHTGGGAGKAYLGRVTSLMASLPSIFYDPNAVRSRPRPPTQAFSQFLINREQGDWAEERLKQAINSQITEVLAVKYGRSDNTVAGEPGFVEFFNLYHDELENIGKRPDLLIFKRDEKGAPGQDLNTRAAREVQPIVQGAIGGIEVRSSSFLALARPEDLRDLSVTVKVEDLHVTFRWIQNHGVPHYFAQVFFDSVYILPFETILTIISDPDNNGTRFTVERNQRNQFKTTIHISITEAKRISSVVKQPQHASTRRQLSSGRLLFYVKFSGGNFALDRETLLAVLCQEQG